MAGKGKSDRVREMKTLRTIALLTVISALTAVGAQADPQWTWEAGKQTINGAITVKSATGGTTYSGTQNPTGAVAKTNQSAVTQPPTVIIQATGSQYTETIPMLVNYTLTVPSCPAGYTSIWSQNGNSVLSSPVINAGGSRLSLMRATDTNGNGYTAWFMDENHIMGGTFVGQLPYVLVSTTSSTYNWAANLCTK